MNHRNRYLRWPAVSATLLLVAACAAGSKNAAHPVATENKTVAMSAQEREAVAHLQWLDNTDPIAEAKRSITEGRPALLTLGGRGAMPPGISAEQQARLGKQCKIEILPGATDMVQGDTHLRYLERARDYAEQYNRAMLAYCSR